MYGETELANAYEALTGDRPDDPIIVLHAESDGASGGVIVNATVQIGDSFGELAGTYKERRLIDG